MKILFCNIAWMKYYQGTCDEDIPVNGGSYVNENQSAGEAYNFLPVDIQESDSISRTYVLGSFETKSRTGDKPNQVHIEKIKGCSGLSKEDYAEGVLVVWCATTPNHESRVVGWYKNATVCRWYESIDIEEDDGTTFERIQNIFALASDVVLLPESERYQQKWKAPRNNSKTGTPYGFFRSNVWYGLEDKAQEFIKQLVDNINGYNGENALEHDKNK